MSDVVVVGAGPGGMDAALSAARAGSRVLLVDAAARSGGEYYRRPPASATGRRSGRIGRLEQAIDANPRIEFAPRTTIWAVEPVAGGVRIHTQSGPADAPAGEQRVVETAALVLATGAYDRALPFPGWDLPGVVTAGAAQVMAKEQGIGVGREVIVSGTGPFLLPVAGALLGVGARVRAVLDATVPYGWLRRPMPVAENAGKLGELAAYAAVLARHRVPYRIGRAVVAAHGDGRVEEATVARLDRDWNVIAGTERRVPADAVCVGHGFTPRLELAVAIGCRVEDPPGAPPRVAVDVRQETSVPGVFAAGELTGIGGADLAAAEGTVAGWAAARHLGAHDPAADAHARSALASVRRGRRFAAALAAAHPVRDGWRTWLDDDTVVCRCEEVTYGDLHAALAERPITGLRTLKLTTRAGLGHCQARICGRNILDLAESALPPGTHLTGHERLDRRPIATPIRLGDLATAPAAPPATAPSPAAPPVGPPAAPPAGPAPGSGREGP